MADQVGHGSARLRAELEVIILGIPHQQALALEGAADALGEPLDPCLQLRLTRRCDASEHGWPGSVPGALAMLGALHARHGALPWPMLLKPALIAADTGFPVPQRLARFVNGTFPQSAEPDVRAIFSRADGSPVQAGDLLRNPADAQTLQQISQQGPRALLEPPLRDAIIERTHAEPRGGRLTAGDFDAYHPKIGEPVCGPFLVYVVCLPPPPSSGVALLQLLAMLEEKEIGLFEPTDTEASCLFAEASRLTYADRDKYIADAAFVDVPVAGLVDAEYLLRRAALIGAVAGPAPVAGIPAPIRRGSDATSEASGTSRYVIVDRAGNVVSITTTVESLFGSGRAVGGFMLNNQLTDFSFRPEIDGTPVANAVAGGSVRVPRWRPSSCWTATTRRKRWSDCSPGNCRCSRPSSCGT